jgi:hypothetical protein
VARTVARIGAGCPKNPDFAPGYEGMAAYEVRDRYLIMVGDPQGGKPSQLPTAQAVGFHPIGFPGRYSRVESTVVIVDDRWALIGGSTFRHRGLTFDGSSDLVLTDTLLRSGRSPAIRNFRRTLLAARLGIPADQEHPSFVQLADGRQAFGLIRQTLQSGGLGKIDLWWNGATPASHPSHRSQSTSPTPTAGTLTRPLPRSSPCSPAPRAAGDPSLRRLKVAGGCRCRRPRPSARLRAAPPG